MLEAMLPARTALAQTAVGQVKPSSVGVFFPHGMAPGYWSPEAEGPLPEKLPHIAEALAKVKDETTILSGMWSKSAEPPEGSPSKVTVAPPIVPPRYQPSNTS